MTNLQKQTKKKNMETGCLDVLYSYWHWINLAQNIYSQPGWQIMINLSPQMQEFKQNTKGKQSFVNQDIKSVSDHFILLTTILQKYLE